MMIRVLSMSYVAMIAALTFGNYHVTYATDRLMEEKKLLERAIAEEEGSIRLLEAEFERRSSNEQIARLSAKYLPDLAETPPAHLVSLEDIPLRRDPAVETGDLIGDLIAPVAGEGGAATAF